MKLTSLSAPLVGISLLAGACGGTGADSKDALVEKAVAAVKGYDGGGYAKLMVDKSLIETHCPKLFEAEKDKIDQWEANKVKDIEERLANSCEGHDWDAAKQVSVVGGEEDGASGDCEAMTEYSDIRAKFEVGGKTVTMVLRDPVQFKADGVWAFMKPPRCRVGGAGEDGPGVATRGGASPEDRAVELMEKVADDVCACADEACAMAAIGALEKAGKALEKELGGKPSPALMARMKPHNKRLGECMSKLN